MVFPVTTLPEKQKKNRGENRGKNRVVLMENEEGMICGLDLRKTHEEIGYMINDIKLGRDGD